MGHTLPNTKPKKKFCFCPFPKKAFRSVFSKYAPKKCESDTHTTLARRNFEHLQKEKTVETFIVFGQTSPLPTLRHSAHYFSPQSFSFSSPELSVERHTKKDLSCKKQACFTPTPKPFLPHLLSEVATSALNKSFKESKKKEPNSVCLFFISHFTLDQKKGISTRKSSRGDCYRPSPFFNEDGFEYLGSTVFKIQMETKAKTFIGFLENSFFPKQNERQKTSRLWSTSVS